MNNLYNRLGKKIRYKGQLSVDDMAYLDTDIRRRNSIVVYGLNGAYGNGRDRGGSEYVLNFFDTSGWVWELTYSFYYDMSSSSSESSSSEED